SDSKRAWVSAPMLREFQMMDASSHSTPFNLPPDASQQVGPVRLLPVYRMLLGSEANGHFLADARNPQFIEAVQVHSQPANVIKWEHNASAFLRTLGLTNDPAEHRHIPVTAWVNSSNH